MPFRRSRLAIAALLVPLLVPPAGVAQEEAFFETNFDGGWVGTLTAGADRQLLQLQFNVADGSAIGTVFSHAIGESSITAFAPEFGRIRAKKLIVSFEPVETEQPTRAAVTATTLTLNYKAASDTLAGKAKGGTKGKLALVRMDPELVLQRIWTGTVKRDGEDVGVMLQLEQTPDDSGARFAADAVSGWGWVGEEQGPVTGTRTGATVDLTVALPSGDTTAALKLKRKNSQLKGTIDDGNGSVKVKLVPVGSNNGKPMKVASVLSTEVPAGSTGVVGIKGRNFGTGALVHADDPEIEVVAVDVVSPKRLDALVSADEALAAGTAIAVRVVNGDGQTAEKSNAFTVGEGDGGGGGGISFASDVQPIFGASCASAGCHSTGSAQAGLVLAAGSAFANIVNVPSTQSPSRDRIEPGAPDDSYLVMKIRGDSGITGARMPLNRTPLSQAQIDIIVAWVQAGAPNNGPVRE